MDALLQDARYALRLLRRSPGFAATAILTMALSIGANAAIFSAIKGVLIAPLPYPEPDRLVRLFEEAPTSPHFPMAPADFRDYRNELQTFDGIAAYFRADLQLGDANRPEQLRGMQVTAGFFKVVGVPPSMGREFELNDELEGNTDGVLLSHALWQRRFNSDPAIIGQPLRLSGRMFRVIGIVPENFQHVGGSFRTYGHGERVDIWSVLPVPRGDRPSLRYSHFYNVVGRLKREATWAAMQEDLQRTSASVAKRYPQPNSPWKPLAVPLKAEIVGTAGTTLVVLAAAAAAVLLLACVNVAGLLLGRATTRSREVGVRAALGATRGRLARQLLIESLVLSIAGGALGVGLAFAAVAALARFGPGDLPRLQDIAVDGQVLLYAVAATFASALVFGFAPALRLVRAGVATTLREGGRSVAGGVHQPLRRVLAAAEVALAFVLVVSSALLLRSFVSMINAAPGFDPQGVITASVDLPTARYKNAEAAEFYRSAAERLAALPGIRSVAFSSDLPWTGYDENTSFDIVGRQFPPREGPEARYHFVTHDFARAIGTAVIAGREITTADARDARPVVLVNEAAARKYWSTPQAAVGARLNLWGKERTIAGVIGDVRDMPWHLSSEPALYFPQPQEWYAQPMFVIARTDLDPPSVADSVRRTIQAMDPELPLANVRALEGVAGSALATRRLTLWLVASFGLTALFLAVVGIYGVMAQAVGQRQQEFGVRQALGATRTDIMRLVLSSSAGMTACGLVAGIALAIGSTRLLTALLYDVTALDVATFLAVTVILVAASAVASYLPARRATRLDAATVLRAVE